MNLTQEVITTFFNDHYMRFSAETIRSYRIALKQFFSFCKKEYTEVKATDIRTWLASLEEKGLKPNSIHLKLSALKSFYHYCIEENRIIKNPTVTVQTPKIIDSLPCRLFRKK